MENRRSHDKLRGELNRRGLPRAYIERLLSELDDHYTDLLEERSTSMGAARKLQIDSDDVQQRLGQPTDLAIFASEQYHARTFWGRHPLITYLAAPLPLLIACLNGYLLSILAVGFGIKFLGTRVFGWTDSTFANPADYIWLQAVSLALISWYLTVFPPLTAAWLLCRTYRRNALDWRWPVLGCMLLAIVSGTFDTSYRIATEPNTGRFMFGFDVAEVAGWQLRFLARFTLAMGIGLLLIKRAQRQLEVEA